MMKLTLASGCLGQADCYFELNMALTIQSSKIRSSIQLANFLLLRLEQWGYSLYNFDRDALLKQAKKQAHLSDFGDLDSPRWTDDNLKQLMDLLLSKRS